MESILVFILSLVVQTLISGCLLWVGLILTGESGDIRALFLAALIANLFGFIPAVGGLISFVVLLILLSKWTTVEVFPGGILVVLVANILGIFLTMFLLGSIV